MSKTEKFLALEQEFKVYVPVLQQAGDVIRDENISNYPIFAAHQGSLEMGIPVIEKHKHGGRWNINATTLEEFVAKNVIFTDKVDEFLKSYKNPDEFVCIFILSELGATFNYFPVAK